MSNTLRFKPAISMQAGSLSMNYCGLLTFFKINFFQKLLSRTQSEYQTVLGVQIRTDALLVLTRVQTVCEGYQRRTENYGTCTIETANAKKK